MDIETARWVVIGIASVAFVVWLCGYTYVRSVARQMESQAETWDDFDGADSVPPNWIVGSAEIQTPSHHLADQAVAGLLRGGNDGIGAVKILEKSPDRVRFESVESEQSQTRFERGQIQWTRMDQQRTRVDYVLELAPNLRFLWGARLALTLGFLALVIGAPLLYFFVASSPIVAVRTQAIQMVQIIHFLWPPFVFAHVYQRGRQSLRARMDALVHNLPYLQSQNAAKQEADF